MRRTAHIEEIGILEPSLPSPERAKLPEDQPAGATETMEAPPPVARPVPPNTGPASFPAPGSRTAAADSDAVTPAWQPARAEPGRSAAGEQPVRRAIDTAYQADADEEPAEAEPDYSGMTLMERLHDRTRRANAKLLARRLAEAAADEAAMADRTRPRTPESAPSAASTVAVPAPRATQGTPPSTARPVSRMAAPGVHAPTVRRVEIDEPADDSAPGAATPAARRGEAPAPAAGEVRHAAGEAAETARPVAGPGPDAGEGLAAAPITSAPEDAGEAPAALGQGSPQRSRRAGSETVARRQVEIETGVPPSAPAAGREDGPTTPSTVEIGRGGARHGGQTPVAPEAAPRAPGADSGVPRASSPTVSRAEPVPPLDAAVPWPISR